MHNDDAMAYIQRLGEKMFKKGGLEGSHGPRTVPLHNKSSIRRSLQVTSERNLSSIRNHITLISAFSIHRAIFRKASWNGRIVTRLPTISQIQQAQGRTCLSPKTLIHFTLIFSFMASLSSPGLILKYLSQSHLLHLFDSPILSSFLLIFLCCNASSPACVLTCATCLPF